MRAIVLVYHEQLERLLLHSEFVSKLPLSKLLFHDSSLMVLKTSAPLSLCLDLLFSF
jgi:hypothetical protein